MLAELRVRDLGVVADLSLVLDPGMTAVTGETGAGKTLLVEAIELLMGGRADASLVRAGAREASVEGRFVTGHDEAVLARAVPAAGRSRSYLDGAMVPVSVLAEVGAGLVDLHGQHAHQSLLAAAAQRAALDSLAGVDHAPLLAARSRLRDVEAALAQLGGDERARAREADLLRFQLGELGAAALDDPDEDAALEAEEARLAHATADREAAMRAHEALSAEGGGADAVGAALAAVAGRAPLAELEGRLRDLAAGVAEAASDLRRAAEVLEDDPERLDAVAARRRLLRDLRRKYGDTLADVMAFADQARGRLADIESHAGRVADLEAQRGAARSALARAEAAVGAARRGAAPRLASAVEAHLRELAMPRARFLVEVGPEDPGDRVTFLLAANPGEPALPLARVASGGELSRTMLAVRVVLRALATTVPAPAGGEAGAGPTVVFDEVDAGVGGHAALAVGRSLAALAAGPGPAAQVLVVTHLPQVAAFADHQVAVDKAERDGRVVAEARVLDAAGRVVELSRMLSGQPESTSARLHAQELLATAAAERHGPGSVGG